MTNNSLLIVLWFKIAGRIAGGFFLAVWTGARPDPDGFPLINLRGWFKYY